MLRSTAIDILVEDLANQLNEQFRYIPTAKVENQQSYEAAIKDCTIAVVTALHKNIVDFNVDEFYSRAGYPGTHPWHRKVV